MLLVIYMRNVCSWTRNYSIVAGNHDVRVILMHLNRGEMLDIEWWCQLAVVSRSKVGSI